MGLAISGKESLPTSQMATLAPLASSRSAIARPMPEAPAVITTRWPASAPPARPFDEPPRFAAAMIFPPVTYCPLAQHHARRGKIPSAGQGLQRPGLRYRHRY
jgi:hypothetical protein